MRKAEYTRSVDNELLATALWIERSANDKSGLTKRTNGYRWDYCSVDEYFRTWIVILFLDGKKRYLARLLGRVISGFEWPDLLRCLPPSLMGSKEEMPKRIFCRDFFVPKTKIVRSMKWNGMNFHCLELIFHFFSDSSSFGSDWKTWFVCADSRREIRANGFAISVPYRRWKWFSEITTLRSEFRYSNLISRLGFGVQ